MLDTSVGSLFHKSSRSLSIHFGGVSQPFLSGKKRFSDNWNMIFIKKTPLEKALKSHIFIKTATTSLGLCRPKGMYQSRASSEFSKTQYQIFETNIPKKGITRPQSQFPHLCVCERFLYSQAGSICLFCCRKVCGPILGIYLWTGPQIYLWIGPQMANGIFVAVKGKAKRKNIERSSQPYELLQTQASGVWKVQARLLACTPWFFAGVEITKLQTMGNP